LGHLKAQDEVESSENLEIVKKLGGRVYNLSQARCKGDWT
jgi:hypothetical protein